MAIEFITNRWLSWVRLWTWREGKKRAGMEEKLGEGIERKEGRRLGWGRGKRDFPDIHHAITKTSSRWWFPPMGITRAGC